MNNRRLKADAKPRLIGTDNKQWKRNGKGWRWLTSANFTVATPADRYIRASTRYFPKRTGNLLLAAIVLPWFALGFAECQTAIFSCPSFLLPMIHFSVNSFYPALITFGVITRFTWFSPNFGARWILVWTKRYRLDIEPAQGALFCLWVSAGSFQQVNAIPPPRFTWYTDTTSKEWNRHRKQLC